MTVDSMGGTPSAILTALAAIQAKVPVLEKNGIGPSTQGSYKFLAVDDVLGAIRPLLVENGVIVVPTLADKGFHYNAGAVGTDGRVAKESIHAWVEYTFDFMSVVDGSSLMVTVIGEGIDTQDKAIRKATTSAWKIALIQTFALITGEVDPDAQDGAGDSQGGNSPADRKVAAAKPKATPAVRAEGAWKQKIRTDYLTPGTVSAAQLGDVGRRVAKEQDTPWDSNNEQLCELVYGELAKGLVE